MRALGLLVWLAGCQSPTGLQCSTLQPCSAGGYQFCQSGSGCYYSLSDGTTRACTTCGSCQSAVQAVNDWCDPPTPDMAVAPDLSSVANPVSIPKSGPPYTGTHTDPGLNNLSQCPDASLEPNDGPDPGGNPLTFTPTPDQPTAKIIKLAICPTGNNPLTGFHDVDWFKVDNSSGPPSLTLTAEVFYDITFGDLDVAIFDSQLHLLSADGTAVTNGCTAAAIAQGVYYVVVAGANNLEVNRYELLIRSYAAPHTYP